LNSEGTADIEVLDLEVEVSVRRESIFVLMPFNLGMRMNSYSPSLLETEDVSVIRKNLEAF